MEMEAAAAAAVDFNALSRRELQALCKLNGVRANMTNLAMVEALQSLASVDGIDQIGTTLCLPTPGKSAMKSVLKATPAAGEDQQQQLGSPLPRGRRVSVKSPEAIRMDVEEGEDEMKRNLIKEIVRTPGVALRSTSRRPRATPAPLPPTPAAGTLRRSQRSTRKTEKAMEAEVPTTKRSTRKPARSKAMFDLDQEEEDSTALKDEKVQEAEPNGVTSDEKCGDPEEEEEVTKLPEEGNSTADEPEQGDEVVSSVVPIESADKSCDNSKLDEVVEEATKLQEAAVEEEQKLASAEKSVPLTAMEDSPILGLISKATPEPAIKNVEGVSTEDGESGKWSPVLEIDDEINSASEDKEVAAVEVPKEAINGDAFNSTAEAADVPNKMIPAAVTEKEVAGYNFQEDAFNSTVKASDALNEMTPAAVTEKEVAAADFKEDAFNSTVDSADAPNEMTPAVVTEKDVAADDIKENAFTSTVETADAPNKMIPAAVTEKEVADDDLPQSDLTEDDFSTDLPSEFDDIELSDAETESHNSPMVPKQINSSSAAKTVDSAITSISLRKLKSALKEGLEELEAKTVDSAITGMSLKKLKSALKEALEEIEG